MSKFITQFCIGFIDQPTIKVGEEHESAQQIFARAISDMVSITPFLAKFLTNMCRPIRKHNLSKISYAA